MANYSDFLHLKLPLGSKNWNLDTWNGNMKILDDGYLDLQEVIISHLGADELTVFSQQLESDNVQDAITEIMTHYSSLRYFNVTDDMRILIPAEGHSYLVLTFGETVPEVVLDKFPSDSEREISWVNGEPTFEANSTYEISLLKLSGIWYKRQPPPDYSQFFDYYIEDNILYITKILASEWFDYFGNYDVVIPSSINGYPVMLDGEHWE